MNVEQFVLRHLPREGCRVLEVGCGEGELALSLAKRGFEVTAIDPEAPSGAIFRRVPLEQFVVSETFEAVIASRSLHHIHDLRDGLKKIHSLLGENGRIILDEFAWERMDEKTAHWYLGLVDESGDAVSSLLPENFPHEWVAEHDGLHDSTFMRRALDDFFEQDVFEWAPYVSVHCLKRPDLRGEELRLIESGEISPLGFRYVGSSKKVPHQSSRS